MKRSRKIAKIFERERILNTEFAHNGPHEMILVLDHLKPDFNVGKIFRSAEALGVFEVCLVGIPFFDPSPALGCFRKVKAKFFPDFASCWQYLKEQGFSVYAFDCRATTYMHQLSYPLKSAFVFGHEEYGLSFKLEDFPEVKWVKIQQVGQVESLNVSIAASLSIYEFVRQNYLHIS